jgi:hypothetical protein
MKYLLFIPSLFLIISCGNKTENLPDPYSRFGDSIAVDNAGEIAGFISDIGTEGKKTGRVSGKVLEVCQKKGCWMTLDAGNNQTIRVTFKDYGFFVPMDIAGKQVIIEGFAYNDTTSVEELKHYAEDAGKPKEEIEKITEPEIKVSFEAHGVAIKNE